MGWEAMHLIQFSVRGVVYAGPHLHGQPVDVPLADFRFRRNAKFRCVYDMRCWWEHELRVEDSVSAVSANRHPACIGGSSACPPEKRAARREGAVMTDLASHVIDFLREHMPLRRNASLCTIASYGHSLMLLVCHVAKRFEVWPIAIAVEQLKADVVCDFLDHLEADRGNRTSTRSVRLTESPF